MSDITVWRAQVDHFEPQRTVQVFDYGELDSLPAMARKVLSEAPPRFALAGHSMGGRIALEVMRLAPERVTHLALLDTGCHALPEGKAAEPERTARMRMIELARSDGVQVMARSWLRTMVHPDRLSDDALAGAIEEMFARKTVAHFEAQVHALLNRPEAYDVVESIRCPTLILAGEQDALSPAAANREMATAIPRATLAIVPECGHMAPQEKPADVNRHLADLLSR